MTTLIFSLRSGSREVELLPDELSSGINITPERVTINGREVLRAQQGMWIVVDPDSDLDGLYQSLDVYL